MPLVISASRRTDIPAFYSSWFVQRLKMGSVAVQQPYSGKILRVSLKREDVSAIVFWSKNYSPLVDRLDAIEATTKNLFFHFTISGARELETSTPDYRDAIRDYVFLAVRYSPEQLIWRFDPICITDKLPFEVFEERFTQCAELLKGYAQKCVISFVHPYKKVMANLAKYTDHCLVEVSMAQKRRHAGRIAEIGARYGIRISACCNDNLVDENVAKAACIDGAFMSSLYNAPVDTRPASSRKECACTKSVDIGAYDTCAHGCFYCYATMDKERARKSLSLHNPEWNSLHMDIPEEDDEKAQQNILCSNSQP
jgi:Domain of unknown function (DUF1848)